MLREFSLQNSYFLSELALDSNIVIEKSVAEDG
jgi:hypothetical protein